MKVTAPVPPSQALVISERVYRILLAAYPAEFRRRYGPEMAQVFRTCCRASYQSNGPAGVLRLWLPTLWDWAWSAASEWFSSWFRRSKVYHIHPQRTSSQLIPILFFLNACLICLFANPCSWLGGEFMGTEGCGIIVNNQSGKTLRVTPIYADGNSSSAVRLYRNDIPVFSAYQQRNISVKYGDQVQLHYDCSQNRVLELYACDPAGECYVHKDSNYVYPFTESGRDVGFTFGSLDSLSRPEAAQEAAVQSFPEYNYSYVGNVLLCLIVIIALIGGFYSLVRARTYEIPKHDI